jgi:hypothetical protein
MPRVPSAPHHEGFENAATVLCRQAVFADLLRLMLFENGSGRTSFDVGRAVHVRNSYNTSSNISRPSISSNPAIPRSARSAILP